VQNWEFPVCNKISVLFQVQYDMVDPGRKLDIGLQMVIRYQMGIHPATRRSASDEKPQLGLTQRCNAGVASVNMAAPPRL
jgi:hypothetical protein